MSLLDSVWLSPAADTVPATKELFAKFPRAYVNAGGSESLIHGIHSLVKRFKLSEVDTGQSWHWQLSLT